MSFVQEERKKLKALVNDLLNTAYWMKLALDANVKKDFYGALKLNASAVDRLADYLQGETNAKDSEELCEDGG